VDLTALEQVEEDSESLANALLDLSVATRERDLERVAGFLADDFSALPFPSRPTTTGPQVKWIATHGWEAEGAEPVGKPAWLEAWGRFLGHFGAIEDARFKVKQASFEGGGRARVAFFVIGRDLGGRREWAHGFASILARREAAGWQVSGFEVESLESMTADSDLFSEVSAPAGLALDRTPPSETDRRMQPFSWVWRGAAAADFDGDGWVDLFVASASGNHLYLNDGRGRFRDVGAEAGVRSAGGPSSWSSGPLAPLVLDYDNDGDPDIFLSVVGKQVLLENRLVPDGKLVFRDVSEKAGVALQAYGFSAAAGDVNGDGRPDIYVACYDDFIKNHPNSFTAATNATPNLLFVNQGGGTFREEAARWGVDDRRWSLAAAFTDVDGDGKLDLFVANDYGEKGLFMNQGDRFLDQARERGVLDPGFGMGVSFGDYDNDGVLDLHATDMSSTAGNRILSRLYPGSEPTADLLKKLARGNSLFRGVGGGRFQDVTADVGGLNAGWAWGGGFVDFDNDGWEDVYAPNGYISGSSMKDT
jgi:hypothetical protein